MALTERSGNLNKKLAAHLLRRASFRFTKDRVDDLAAMTAVDAVDDLFSAPPLPYTVRPLNYQGPDSNVGESMDWIPLTPSYGPTEIYKREYVVTWWYQNALLDPTATHKCAFFLHTTFSTGFDGLVLAGDQNHDVSSYQYDHYRLLNWLCANTQSLKDAARKITLDNLMLGYLDNRINAVDALNENYAREFLELFTIGRGNQTAIEGEYSNYTEADITEAAKIFSGFTHADRRYLSPIDIETTIPRGVIDTSMHQFGDKQFSNKFSGNTTIEGNDISQDGMMNELQLFIDLVFAQEATALNYATKIYRYFVSSELDTDVVEALADHLFNNDYNFIETIKTLLKSEHFYSFSQADYGGGNIIKSPIDLLSNAMSFFDVNLFPLSTSPTVEEAEKHFFRFGSYLLRTLGRLTGMKLFSPINVAGYPAYHQEPLFDKSWYSPGALAQRFDIGWRLLFYDNAIAPDDENIDGDGIPDNCSLCSHIDSVKFVCQLDQSGIEVSNADTLIDVIVSYLFPQAITTERKNVIKNLFVGSTEDHWEGLWLSYKSSITDDSGTNCDDSTESDIKDEVKSHTNALILAILSAHEFQLK